LLVKKTCILKTVYSILEIFPTSRPSKKLLKKPQNKLPDKNIDVVKSRFPRPFNAFVVG